jgi:hypothetical protein
MTSGLGYENIYLSFLVGLGGATGTLLKSSFIGIRGVGAGTSCECGRGPRFWGTVTVGAELKLLPGTNSWVWPACGA